MDKIQTFVLVHDNEVISPALVTIREYGRWFEETFDEYTSQMELYMKSVKKGGESVLEWHPGTRIGKYFDTVKLNGQQYKCCSHNDAQGQRPGIRFRCHHPVACCFATRLQGLAVVVRKLRGHGGGKKTDVRGLHSSAEVASCLSELS